ncbi:MAG: helix-turn-helix domain-containing protein [Hyphomicrobium sp.]
MSRATAKANLRSVPLDDGVLCGTDWPLLPDAEYVCAVLRHETLAIFRSARSTVYELLNSGELPSFKVGKTTLILHDDLQVYLRRRAERGR